VQTRPQRADRITDSATPLNYAQDRQPPYNLDAERAILGAVLLDREAVGLAVEKLMPEEFHRKEHRLICTNRIKPSTRSPYLKLWCSKGNSRPRGGSTT